MYTFSFGFLKVHCWFIDEFKICSDESSSNCLPLKPIIKTSYMSIFLYIIGYVIVFWCILYAYVVHIGCLKNVLCEYVKYRLVFHHMPCCCSIKLFFFHLGIFDRSVLFRKKILNLSDLPSTITRC